MLTVVLLPNKKKQVLHRTSVNSLQTAFKTYCLSETSFMHTQSDFLSKNLSYQATFSATKFIFTALQWLELAALYRFNFQSVIRLLSLGCLNEQKSHADLLHLFCITKFDEAGYVNFRTFHYEHIAQKVAAISYHLPTRSRSALTHIKNVNVIRYDIDVSIDWLRSRAIASHSMDAINDSNIVYSPYRIAYGPDPISS